MADVVQDEKSKVMADCQTILSLSFRRSCQEGWSRYRVEHYYEPREDGDSNLPCRMSIWSPSLGAWRKGA